MIYLRKGQILKDNPGMVVYDPTGYYNDGDSVVCSAVVSPDEPACRFEAKYIAYGGLVYSITDPDELLKQVIKMDPNSLFGKDSKQIAVDKMVENIVPQKSSDLNQEAVTEPETTATTTPSVNDQTPVATTTPSIITPVNTSTTTPTTIPNLDTSTTTPAVIPPVDISTTTPDIIPDINTSTTTQSILPKIEESTTTPFVLPSVEVPTSTPSIIPDTSNPTTTPQNIDTNTSTTSEVVAFAKNLVKNKISKELGL